MTHTSEDDKTHATKYTIGFESFIILLIGLDIMHNIIQVLTGDEQNNDDPGEKREQIIHLEVGILPPEKNRVHYDIEDNNPEIRRVLDQIRELLFENALKNRKRPVKAAVTDIREAHDQEITLQKENDLYLVTITTNRHRLPCNTVTRMSE